MPVHPASMDSFGSTFNTPSQSQLTSRSNVSAYPVIIAVTWLHMEHGSSHSPSGGGADEAVAAASTAGAALEHTARQPGELGAAVPGFVTFLIFLNCFSKIKRD